MLQTDFIFSLVDLTNLNEKDTLVEIEFLCHKAIENKVAAVCVYPQFVHFSARFLSTTDIKIATVANFPEGKDSIEKVLTVIQQAIHEGADEIDVVFPYQEYLLGQKQKALDFISSCKTVCSDKTLKVILETGAFADQKILYEASCALLETDVDFLKTSTGKIAVGATFEAVNTLLKAIKDMKSAAGLKISGGIRTVELAEKYIQLAEEKMGFDFIQPKHFRIGASRLG